MTKVRYTLGIGLGLVVACAGPVNEPAPEHSFAPLRGSFAAVQIVESELDALTEPQTHISGVFAEYQGVDGAVVLDLLGDGYSLVELESCAIANDEPLALEPDARVRLRDVGQLRVDAGRSRATIRQRAFPELGDLMDGVIYTDDARLGLIEAEYDEYRVAASGSAAVPPFSAVVLAPEPPVIVLDSDRVAAGLDLAVYWDAGSAQDRVEVELFSGGAVIHCVFLDDGVATIPAAQLLELNGEADNAADGLLVLRRVRMEALDVPGIDVGWVSVEASHTLPLEFIF